MTYGRWHCEKDHTIFWNVGILVNCYAGIHVVYFEIYFGEYCVANHASKPLLFVPNHFVPKAFILHVLHLYLTTTNHCLTKNRKQCPPKNLTGDIHMKLNECLDSNRST